MRSFAFLLLLGLAAGCDSDAGRAGTPAENRGTDVDINTNRAPDLDPRTDHDIDIKTPNVDVNVDRDG